MTNAGIAADGVTLSADGTIRSKAAVLHAPGMPLAIEEIEIGPLRAGDVLVRIEASSLCHTDLEVIDGQLAYPMPIVLGHEAAGRIVATGAAVPTARLGERVVLSWNPHCGHCFQCEADAPILCDHYLATGPRGLQLDGATRLRQDGRAVSTMFFIAGFAEYAIVSATCAVRVPDAIPADRACLIGCAVMTGVGAATHIGNVAIGECVMVLGCGAVGLAAIQGARMAGASRIVAVDPIAGKRDLALRVGATHFVAPDAAAALVKSLTDGRGADAVIECAGRPAAFQLSAEACRVGGRIVWTGKVGIDDQVEFRWGSLMGEKRIVRSSYGGARPGRDFPMLAQAYLDGRLMLDELISRRIALDEINAGFDALRAGEVIRCVVTF